MTSEETKEELKTYSKKHNINLLQLNELVYLVFKFIRNKIKSADSSKDFFPSVRVMGMGVFFVTTHKRNRLKKELEKELEKELKNKKDER